MKKILLVAGLALASMAVNAQLYVGGQLGFESTSIKPDQGDAEKSSEFTFGPEVGYSLSDKFDVGAELLISTGKEFDETKTTNWQIAPYARYAVAEFGNFKVLGKASIFFGGNSSKQEVGNTTVEASATEFGLRVAPLLTYNLSDNFLLLTQLNFLGLNFTSTSVKDGNTTTDFGLNANTNNALSVGGGSAITVGFAYCF